MRGASCPQKVSRNITVAKSDKYLCWKRGCVDRRLCFLSRLSDTFWCISAMDSLVTWSPAAHSALQLPPYCHTISAGCRSLPELLHCFIHWVTGMSSHPDHSTEEVREKQFHRTFLGRFSNFIWLLMSQTPKGRGSFLSLLPFSLADLVHLDNWSRVSKSFRSLHSKWVGPWNGFIWHTEGCAMGTGARIGRRLPGFGSCSACLTVSHFHGSRTTDPTKVALMLHSIDPIGNAGAGNQMGAWFCDLKPVVWSH